jgi:hypothetical protein
MSQEPTPHLALVYQNNLSEAPIEEFVRTVRKPGLDLRVSSAEPSGPMGGVEWMLPTAVILYIGKAYFDTFLKEAGKDHYALLKKGLTAFWSAYLSSRKEVTIRLVGTPGKLDPDQRYSHVFSIYTPTRDGVNRIKFLFDETCPSEVFYAQVKAVLNTLEEYHTGSPDSVLHNAIQASRRQHPYLVRYNSESGELELFDPMLSRKLPKP